MSTPTRKPASPKALEKVRATKQVRHVSDPINERLAVKIPIGFIDQHGRLGRGGGDGQQVFARGHRARRIVGRGQHDQLGGRSDRPQDLARGECEILSGLHVHNFCPSGERVDLVERKRRHHDQRFVAGFEIGFAEQVNRFIHAVGKQQAFDGDAEIIGNRELAHLPLRILVEHFGRNGGQNAQDARRASADVLVEIEPQAFAPSQRRVILLQVLDNRTCF